MFVTGVQLRWTDLDAQGHVNNVMVADYLQQARARFLMSGPANRLLESGLVVVAHQVFYRAPIRYSSKPLSVELWVSELGAARFVVAYRLVQDARLCVEARTTLCPFDFEKQSPRRLKRLERRFFSAHHVPAEQLGPLAAPALSGRGTPLDVYTRWSDPDRYGHVNNVRFLDFVMAGRIDMTTRADPTMARTGMGRPDALQWLVVRQDIDYVAQMEFRLTPHRVLTAPVRIGETSIVLATEIVDPEARAVLAQARAVLVCADANGDKRPLPDTTRLAMKSMLVRDS